jgi:hypothetical protein
MAELFEFALYDADGVPAPTAGASFLLFTDRNGNNLTPPTITHVGGGVFTFTVPSNQSSGGVCFVVTSSAGAYPERSYGSTSDDLVFIHLTNDDGSSFTGTGTPTFAIFKDRNASDRTKPAFVSVFGSSSWSFTLSDADLVEGVVYEISLLTGSNPPRANGAASGSSGASGGNIPQVSDVVPTPSTTLTADEAITFKVTDVDVDIHRVFVVVTLPNSGVKEVVHDGDSFGPKYQNVSNYLFYSGPSSEVFNFSILRDGGWPESPTLTVYAIDDTGGENS